MAAGAVAHGGGSGRASAASAAGMLILVFVLFLTYAGYDIALPFAAEWLPVVAAMALTIGALAGTPEGLTDPFVGPWDKSHHEGVRFDRVHGRDRLDDAHNISASPHLRPGTTLRRRLRRWAAFAS